MGWQDDQIVQAAPQAQPWEKDAIVQPAQGPRAASGIGDAWKAGYQSSVAGLVDRGKLPDVVLDPHHAKWYEKLVAGASQMVNEGPEMLAGAVGGGLAGSLVGPIGTVVGGGAGAFAVPTAIRESLVQYYEHRDGVSSADFLMRAGIVIKHTAKDAVVGAATAGAGVVAGKVAGPFVESAVNAGRIGETTGKVAVGTAVTGAEVSTMTVLPAALEGRLPEPEDFMNAAILVGGLKGAGVAAGRLRQIYAETGRRPEQVVSDAQKDPTIAADLTTPAGAAPAESPAPGMVRYYHGGSPESVTGPLWFTSDLRDAQGWASRGDGMKVWYVDVPKDSPARGLHPEDAAAGLLPPSRIEMPADIASQRRVLAEAAAPVEGQAATAPEIPRAYQAEAQAARAADIVPGVKAEEVRTEPFGPVKQAAGEPAEPTAVNYSYMHTTEDAKAALSRLSTVYEAEIQTQRRGTVSWEQTQAEAGQHIADLLGSTTPFQPREPGTAAGAAELLARKQMLQGAAEDMAVKARQYLETAADSRTPTQTAEYLASIERAAMIQAEFLGARAEAGRALNILKETKLAADRAEQIQELINRYGHDPAELAKMIAEIDNPAAALKFAKEAAKATTWDKVVEAWKAGLVSGPVTQVANVMGNLSYMALRPGVDAVAASIGMLTRAPERVAFTEPLARMIGNIQGTFNGLKAARVAFIEEGAAAAKTDQFRQAIPGTAGYIVRTPFRALGAMDAMFKTMVEQGEAYAIAAREASREGYNPATREYRERVVEISQNLTPEQAQQVVDAGVRGTFQSPLGEKARAAQNFVRQWHLEWAVPFITTPTNVFKEMARHSPAAPIIGEWRQALAKGGPEAQRAMAEMAVGTGISVMATSWALAGNVTGSGDPDPNKRRAAMAAGWQPYSIKVGDKWYSYQRIQPIGTLMGMAADMAQVWEHMTPEESDKLPKIVATAFANAVTNQTFLQGMTNLVQVMADPERYGPKFIQGMAGSVVPAAAGQTAQLMDPYQREVNSMLEAIKNRIPGVRESLMPSRDIFGEPVASPDRLGGISPITERALSDDPVRKEAARLGVGTPEAPKSIELPSAGDSKLGKVQLTPEQRDIFGSAAGHMAYQVLSPMVNSPGWAYMPDFIKQRAFKEVFEKTRAFGKAEALTPEQRQQEIGRITTEINKRLAPPSTAEPAR